MHENNSYLQCIFYHLPIVFFVFYYGDSQFVKQSFLNPGLLHGSYKESDMPVVLYFALFYCFLYQISYIQ